MSGGKRGAPPGSHGKYEEARIEIYCKALSRGLTKKQAAGYASITELTAYNWLRRYPEFALRTQQAIANGVALHAENLQKAALGYKFKSPKRRLDKDGKVEHTEETTGLMFKPEYSRWWLEVHGGWTTKPPADSRGAVGAEIKFYLPENGRGIGSAEDREAGLDREG